MARDIDKIFDKMIADMCEISEEGLLDACMTMNTEVVRYVPLRYRIIALGFVKKLSLEELNDKLAEQGCPRLYSRSFWEAVLIFAFKNRYSYSQWKELQARCRDLYAGGQEKRWFTGKKITYAELEQYVCENSGQQGDTLETEMRTRYLEEEIQHLDSGIDSLRAFLAANIQSFSDVREKTRYYFCKYLYYWLNRRIVNYFKACRRGFGIDEALSDLLCIKAVTALRRNLTMDDSKK